MLATGVACVLPGAVYMVRRASFLRKARSTSGTVVEAKIQSDDDEDTSTLVVIEFTDSAGRTVRTSGGFRGYAAVGDELPVLYDPNDSSRATSPAFQSYAAMALMLVLFGLCGILLGAWVS